MSKKWTLVSGLHRGTIGSRDSGFEDCDSLEECKRIFEEQERAWRSMGCYVWFATAHGPSGEKVRLSR